MEKKNGGLGALEGTRSKIEREPKRGRKTKIREVLKKTSGPWGYKKEGNRERNARSLWADRDNRRNLGLQRKTTAFRSDKRKSSRDGKTKAA